jgi:Integrase core domain
MSAADDVIPQLDTALPQKFADRNGSFASAKNPTEGEVGEAVQRASRHDLVRALAPRYGHVGKMEKGQILDQVCEVTGYTRKYALALLRHPPGDEPRVRRTRHRAASYGPEEVKLLRLCWLVTDGICSKRLAPFLPELLERLRRRQALREFPIAVQTRVAGMSAATVDRALKPLREQTKVRRGVGTTSAGTLLKRQIAIRTFADWTDARPGFLEMDLVAHCGWSGAGQFLYTLSMVDVATGWVVCAGLRDKRQETVILALQRLRAQLPFRILGLDSDNGTEFINHALFDYCAHHGITFTRSRPYLKNDTCHVEQKNWAVVRRLVGYDRLEWPALPALEHIHDLARDYVNFLHPVRKLVSKSRTGPRVTRRYDVAQTPYHRLLDSGVLSIKMTNQLQALSKHLDPFRLKVQLEAAQRTLAARAVRSDSYVRQP